MAEGESERLLLATQTLGLFVSPDQIEQLVAYVDLLEKWNRAYNLTAIRDRRDIVDRHLIESLSIAPFLSGDSRVDVGTGAGLPGIPLAIIEPGVHYVLLDSNGKKTRFLSEVKRALALTNIIVETTRVESWRPGRHFDAVVTRAFADLGTTLERVDHLMGSQGMLFAMKTESVSKEVAEMPPNTEHVASWDISVPGRDWPFQLLAIRRLRGEDV
ncbi:MAG: 16S rRNA (guanine(527)-N(7))-methyltransferase RsmG [Halieaceae bacterium]|nr:16S rRNA (guanine(527)-N(7))-methyltransferase RsmG [Halieaceae bacterium]|tara:strand:+ start:2013 stop:2657 length:645 start_codon:yes stop_codon:yes gene_type:complete